MTPNGLPMLFRCKACGALLRMTSPKAFSAKIRRHRAAEHPAHRGVLGFNRISERAH